MPYSSQPQNQLSPSATSVIYAFDYIIGYFAFGLVYYILNGMLRPLGEATSSSPEVKTLALFLWAVALLFYMIFGSLFFLNKIREIVR